jgi:hypothetical protein
MLGIGPANSSIGIAQFDAKNGFFHTPPCRIMLLLMPTNRSIPGRSHQPFLVSKMHYDTSDQTLRQFANLR